MEGIGLTRALAPGLAAALTAPLPLLQQPAIPELLHFVYKLNSVHQYTTPCLPTSSPYAPRKALKRLMRRYQRAHARVRAPGLPGKAICVYNMYMHINIYIYIYLSS